VCEALSVTVRWQSHGRPRRLGMRLLLRSTPPGEGPCERSHRGGSGRRFLPGLLRAVSSPAATLFLRAARRRCKWETPFHGLSPMEGPSSPSSPRIACGVRRSCSHHGLHTSPRGAGRHVAAHQTVVTCARCLEPLRLRRSAYPSREVATCFSGPSFGRRHPPAALGPWRRTEALG